MSSSRSFQGACGKGPRPSMSMPSSENCMRCPEDSVTPCASTRRSSLEAPSLARTAAAAASKAAWPACHSAIGSSRSSSKRAHLPASRTLASSLSVRSAFPRGFCGRRQQRALEPNPASDARHEPSGCQHTSGSGAVVLHRSRYRLHMLSWSSSNMNREPF